MPFDAAIGDDDLVTAWVDEWEQGPSETPADRVANLQRSAERHLTTLTAPTSWPQVVMPKALKERLDARTALLILFEGAWTDGTLATWQVLVTRQFEVVQIGREEMPAGMLRTSWQGRSVSMPASGFYVGELRRAVQADPAPLDLSREAEDILAGARERYVRVVDTSAERLRAAGVERLMILPHGPSRCVPIHLAGPADRPLADEWTVTYLTSLAQLTVEPPAAPRQEGVGVFGLSYLDQPGLPRLYDSAAEVAAIAQACGTEPALDAAATEPAFMSALETCRYVHLRAHGRMYVDAPSFHTVFLYPSPGYDGRLRAYEILPLDLSGLELITLGACETALGRVDQLDNPRGLPAALLLAGARAVVGTLWPVYCHSRARSSSVSSTGG